MQKELILNYLILADVNENVLEFITEHRIEVFGILKELLGKDFEFFINKEQNIQKLKNGNEYFKILEDGSVWFKISINHDSQKNESSLYKGGNIRVTINKYSSTITSSYITFEQNQIVSRNVTIKFREDNMFDGEITEIKYNKDFKKASESISYWTNSSTNEIPNQELLTTTKIFNEFGYVTNTTENRLNFNSNAWNFVLSGTNTTILTKIEDKEVRKTIFNKLITLKNNLFNKKEELNSQNIKR